METLFDENGVLNIADIVTQHPAYIAIMEDGIVTDTELKDQADRTVAALRKVQQLCNPEQQKAVLEAISHISVLNAVYNQYELQQLHL